MLSNIRKALELPVDELRNPLTKPQPESETETHQAAGAQIVRVKTNAGNWGFIIGLSGWLWALFFVNISRLDGYSISTYDYLLASEVGSETVLWVSIGVTSYLAGLVVGLIFHLAGGHKNVVISD